ncbi:MAG: hypothetical protein KI790_17015 [Cyclobacteriaceae bacterium]|nr:hypothetical protein [Cyclobacteriaceae bacterium HetDA_MAG_MS6]
MIIWYNIDQGAYEAGSKGYFLTRKRREALQLKFILIGEKKGKRCHQLLSRLNNSSETYTSRAYQSPQLKYWLESRRK